MSNTSTVSGIAKSVGGSIKAPNPKVPGAGDAPVIPIILIMMGGYLLWFTFHYWRVSKNGAIFWPTDPVKAVLQGNPIPAVPATSSASGAVTGTGSTGTTGTGGTGTTTPTPPSGTSDSPSNTPSQNQNIAKLLMASPTYGWSDTANYNALVQLWDDESGWNSLADNASSGAFGIAQSLHGNKGGVGGNEYNASDAEGLSATQLAEANNGDPTEQIIWGLNYIKGRYGSPIAALAHENADHWY